MNTHLFSDQWLGAVEHTLQNASDPRVALNEAAIAIGEQMDAIASMDLDYIWIKSRREFAQLLSSESSDEYSQALWSLVGEIMGLHDRSDLLDDASFEKEVETAIQPIYQDQLAEGCPDEHLWAKLLMVCVVFAQSWSMGYAES